MNAQVGAEAKQMSVEATAKERTDEESESPVMKEDTDENSDCAAMKGRTEENPDCAAVMERTEENSGAVNLTKTAAAAPSNSTVELAATAGEARRRVGKKKDVRSASNLSMKDKYEMFQKM